MRHNDILGLAWYGYGYGFRIRFGLGLLIICLLHNAAALQPNGTDRKGQ